LVNDNDKIVIGVKSPAFAYVRFIILARS